MNHQRKVQVLTAGGASKQKPRNRNKGKAKNPNAINDGESAKPVVNDRTAVEAQNKQPPPPSQEDHHEPAVITGHLEYEEPTHRDEDDDDDDVQDVALNDVTKSHSARSTPYSDHPSRGDHRGSPPKPTTAADESHDHEIIWLVICFLGIMASFVCYGLLLEYTTSGGRKLHELSFLFVTSGLYTLTAAAGRYVRDETPTTIPPARFAVLGLTSMGSTWCSVRSLRYVIFPIQVLAKSCKPVPVMLMGAVMGKKYALRKYINVCMIVMGVALFMSGGGKKKKEAAVDDVDSMSSSGQLIGILLLFVSLCFDGGTGAYEDKLMSVHQVQPFDLMFNIQLGKTILAGIGLLVFNQLHIFLQMVQEMGFLLVGLGLTGAIGQVFIFVTIAKFGALTCSIIGLARKVTTLVASIYFYGHSLNSVQVTGLVISIASMVMDFMGKQKKGGGHGHGGPPPPIATSPDELEKMLGDDDEEDEDDEAGDVELAVQKPNY